MSIEQKFPKAPTDVVYLASSYLQKWSVLLKDGLGTHGGVEVTNGEIMSWLRCFKPNKVMTSDDLGHYRNLISVIGLFCYYTVLGTLVSLVMYRLHLLSIKEEVFLFS